MRDNSKPVWVFLCEDSLDGILTGVYEAYQSRYGHDNIRLELADAEYEISLFSEYRTIVTDVNFANRVMRSIVEQIGPEARQQVIEAAYSKEPDKAEVIYRFLIRGYAMGGRVVQHLSDPYVNRMFVISRMMSNEANRWKEFLRFEVQENGLLTAVIAPKARVVSFIMPHFSDRLPIEDFIIYDRTHDEAGVHRKRNGWFLTQGLSVLEPELVQHMSNPNAEEKRMQTLWKTFFDAIAIEQRKNRDLQRQHLPLRCREDMTEFQSAVPGGTTFGFRQ